MDPTRVPLLIETIPYHHANQIKILYPRVVAMPNQRVQQMINQRIVTQVEELIRSQQQNQIQGNTEMTGFYELKNNQRGVLSLTQNNYAYTPPAAHGLTLLKSLTLNTQTGHVYTLRELFKSGSNYVEILSNLIRAQIKERDVPLLGEFTGIKPDQDFYIADKTLVIYFQLYEITPYVYGFPMFPISVYSIQGIIDEQGPLGAMLPGV